MLGDWFPAALFVVSMIDMLEMLSLMSRCMNKIVDVKVFIKEIVINVVIDVKGEKTKLPLVLLM